MWLFGIAVAVIGFPVAAVVFVLAVAMNKYRFRDSLPITIAKEAKPQLQT